MAVPFINIAPVTTNPRNALLDVTDLNRSIAGYRAGQDQAFDQQTNQLIGDALAKGDFVGAQAAAAKRGDIGTNLQLRSHQMQVDSAGREAARLKLEQDRFSHSTKMDQQRFGLENQRFGMEQQRFKSEQETQELAREQALAKRFAAIGQAFDAEKDDAKATQMLQSLYQKDSRIAEAIKKNLPPEFHNDPRAISRYWTAVANGYEKPRDVRAQEAKIKEDESRADLNAAQAEAARAKPTDIQKRGKDDVIEQIIPDPTAPGGKRAVQLSGPTAGQVDPSTTTNLTGGLKELADIPGRYGGDGGAFGASVFDQAVGGVQGNDPSGESWYNIVGPTARGLGNAWSKMPWVAGPASSSPDEVRRAIEGATNTVAANVKKLIKPPGAAEGTWSEGDQKYLMTIVGNLLQTKDLTSYNRELGNMTRRINANFGTKLPMPDGSASEAGLRLTKPISSLTIDEIGVLLNNRDKLSPDQAEAASSRLKLLREEHRARQQQQNLPQVPISR